MLAPICRDIIWTRVSCNVHKFRGSTLTCVSRRISTSMEATIEYNHLVTSTATIVSMVQNRALVNKLILVYIVLYYLNEAKTD